MEGENRNDNLISNCCYELQNEKGSQKNSNFHANAFSRKSHFLFKKSHHNHTCQSIPCLPFLFIYHLVILNHFCAFKLPHLPCFSPTHHCIFIITFTNISSTVHCLHSYVVHSWKSMPFGGFYAVICLILIY